VITYIAGDLLLSDCNIILHGANCQHVMGAGIARSLVQRWPIVHQVDKTTAKTINKLGSFSIAEVETQRWVYNLYTQLHPGQCFELEALRLAIQSCLSYWTEIDPECKLKIGMPLIGAGIGGGDWNLTEEMLLKELPRCRTVYVYRL